MSRIRQENSGIGIAAPQVGESLCIINIVYKNKEYTIINPQIKQRKGSHFSFESCLSVPTYVYKVIRPLSLTLHGTDTRGDKIVLKCNADEAAMVQHECDHLRGKLISKHGIPVGKKEENKEKLAWANER